MRRKDYTQPGMKQKAGMGQEVHYKSDKEIGGLTEEGML